MLTPLLARIRRLFDLDADPAAIEAHLQADARLRPLVARRPGLRVPGAFDGLELALRAVLGQQVAVKAATTLFGRFAAAFGSPAATPHAALRLFAPTAQRIAEAPVQKVIALGLTRQRAATVHALARAVAGGERTLAPGTDTATTLENLRALPGIGPWTAQYIALRALGDSDAFPRGDLGLLKALRVSGAKALERRAGTARAGFAPVALQTETPSPTSVGEGRGEGHLVRDVGQAEPSVSLALIVRLLSLRRRAQKTRMSRTPRESSRSRAWPLALLMRGSYAMALTTARGSPSDIRVARMRSAQSSSWSRRPLSHLTPNSPHTAFFAILAVHREERSIVVRQCSPPHTRAFALSSLISSSES